MRAGRSGKPGRSPIVDILEDFAVYNDTPGSLTSSRAVIIAGDLASPTAANVLFLGQGGVAPSFVTQNEAPCRRFPPGSAQTCIAYSPFGFPIGRDLSRFPQTIRQNKRFVWDALIQRAVALSATAKFFIGLSDDGTEVGVAGQVLGIQSDATENVGRWTGKHQLTNGGGVVSLGDSGIAPDGNPQHIRFEYYDMFPSPQLNIYINGVRKFQHIGATLPAMGNANEPWNLTMCAGGAAHVIGQQDHNFFNRYYVELL